MKATTHTAVHTLIMMLFSTLASGQHYYLGSEIHSPSPAMDDAYGIGLAINGQYIAVGSYRDDVSIGHDGRVYLYNAITGAYVRTIVGPNPFNNGAFGSDIALDNNLLLVGSRADQTIHGSSGAGYLFDVNTGSLIADFVSETGNPADQTGISVAIQQPIALLGSPGNDDNGTSSGAVHVFLTNLLFQLTTIYPDTSIVNERFGASVAVDGDYIVIGAPGNSTSGPLTGSVYVFDVTSGLQLHRIVPAGSASGDLVGASVDIQNGVIAIGAPYHDRPGLGASGIVYTYNAASGTLINTYNPPEPAVLQKFGFSVALDNGSVIVGSPYSYVGTPYTGSVHVFEDGSVEEVNVFSIPAGQSFGQHVAASGGRIVASGTGLDPIEEGYASLITRYCDADINADGVRDFFDVSAFIKFAIDYNGDGVFNFFDISAFVTDYNSDCI